MENIKTIVWNQFGAAIDSLERAINMCPDQAWCNPALWQDTEQKTLDSYKPEFWYITYHVIFWTDYYLSNETEEIFRPPKPYGMEEFDERGLIPLRVYSKEELLGYLSYCREKCRRQLNAFTEEMFFEGTKTTYRENFSNLELFLYNMRHVQHHTAQLNLLLRQTIDDAPRWVGRTKQALSD